MRRSADRILVSHAGTLPRPDDLTALDEAGPAASQAYSERLGTAVRDVVRAQADLGIDVVNDGELSKQGGLGGFSKYIRDRITGIQDRVPSELQDPTLRDVTARDRRAFPRAFAEGSGWFARRRRRSATRPITACASVRSSTSATPVSSATYAT
jgi:hypothetical protein